MGMFDDLIPAAPTAAAQPAPAPKSGGMFDDLVPQGGQSQPQSQFSVPQTGFQPSPEMEKRFGQLKDIETRHGAEPGSWREIDRIAQGAQGAGLGNAALQGLTFGFGDEAKAAGRAAMTGTSYNTALAGEREGLERYREENPIKAGVAEFAGAIPTLVVPGLNVMRGAGLAARAANAAATGAAYGSLYGAGTGEGVAGRAAGAVTGGVLGGLFGAAAPVAVSGVKGVASAANDALGNVAGIVRGAIDPEKEAARVVAAALSKDNPNVADIPGMAKAMMETGIQRGQPVMMGDVGGETTRAVARSAANTSTEARSALQNGVYGRAGEAQGQRIDNFVNTLMGGNTNADARLQQIQQKARAENRIRYDKAYREGDAGVWSPELEGRFASDAFRSAVRDATRIGSDVAGAANERAVRSPFVFDDAGRATLRVKPDGSQEIPNLRFWDKVKQSLDGQIDRAKRGGDNGEVARLTELKNNFVADLDRAVPSYAEARAGASKFFGAQDALEAGQNFVTMKFGAPETRRALAKMSPAERQLFSEGYASRMVDTIKSIGDNRNVAINSLFNSPAAREKIEIAMGKQRADALEAYMRTENIMDMFKRAVTGNSTTARQLIEAGLASAAPSAVGAAASGLATGSTDPVTLGVGALVGAFTRGKAGAINERVAREVGKMLASTDPLVVRQAFDRIGRSPAMKRRLIDVESLLARELGGSGGDMGGAIGTRFSSQFQGLPNGAAQQENESGE